MQDQRANIFSQSLKKKNTRKPYDGFLATFQVDTILCLYTKYAFAFEGELGVFLNLLGHMLWGQNFVVRTLIW